MLVNFPLRPVPTFSAAAATATPMRAAIKPYSVAVARRRREDDVEEIARSWRCRASICIMLVIFRSRSYGDGELWTYMSGIGQGYGYGYGQSGSEYGGAGECADD